MKKIIVTIYLMVVCLNAASVKEISKFNDNLDKIIIECDDGKLITVYKNKNKNIFIVGTVKTFDSLDESITYSCQN